MKFHDRFKAKILSCEKYATVRDEQNVKVKAKFKIENMRGVAYAEAGLKKAETCIIDRSSVKTESNLYVNESLQEFAKMVGFDSFDDAIEYYTVELKKKLPYVGVLHQFKILVEYK